MSPVSVLVELRRDGTLSGRLLGIRGTAGEMLRAIGATPDMRAVLGPFAQLIGQIEYSGSWEYQAVARILTLELRSQMPDIPAGHKRLQMTITGSDRGVYQAVDAGMMQYTLRRIG